MDIELARTFLEIVRRGSFLAAAERLHITQTTVTARIHNLEGLLGCRLFVRNRSGAHLTDNGRHFLKHANQLVQTWETSRRDLPLPEGKDQLVTLGCETSLWNPLLSRWLSRLTIEHSELAVRVEVGERQRLHEQLQQGILDAVIVHQPDYWPGVQVTQLLEEKLIMVASAQANSPYVYVDWGSAFRKQHDAALPELASATIAMNLGPLALQYLLENGGRGYFRTRVVQRHLEQGVLVRITDAPEFSYPVFLLYQTHSQAKELDHSLSILRSVIKESSDWTTTGNRG